MTLKGWWPLHDDAAQDYSGSGNHGTLNGGVTTGVAGRGGLQGMSFDGSDDNVSFGNVPKGGTGGLTYCAWIKTSTEQGVDIISDYNGNSGKHALLHIAEFGIPNYNLGFTVDDGSTAYTVDSGINPSDGKWHFIVGVRDGNGNLLFYYDGEEIATDTESAGDVDDNESLDVGGGHGLGYYSGSVFDVRIYNRALTSSEIQTLYEWGSLDLARPPTDGTAYYPLDGDATDSWGSNDGTTYGGVSWVDGVRGQAVSLDGTDDEIDMGDVMGSILSNPHTMSFWTKWDGSTSWTPFIGKDGVGRTWIGENGEWDYSSSGGHVVPYTVSDLQNWNHYTIVAGSSGENYYLNGVWVAETSLGRVSDNTESFSIGHDQGGNYGGGEVDDLRVYDFTLTPSEVHDLYRYGTFGRDMRPMLVRA